MIKPIDNIKLKDLARMERTGSVSQLKVWWNLLPVFLYKNKLISFVTDIFNQLNESKGEKDEEEILEEMEDKIQSILEIHLLEASYITVIKDLFIHIQFDSLVRKFKLNRRQSKKIKQSDTSQLKKALNNIAEITGIEIELVSDLSTKLPEIQKHLIFLKDKFKENYGEKPKENIDEKEKIGILEYASSIVSYVSTIPSDLEEMKLTTFLAIRKTANKKYEAERKPLNKNEEDGE